MGLRFMNAVCCDLLIRKNIKGNEYILLSRRKNTGSNDGEYELPGGHLESNEDIFKAMIRETKEELKINIRRKDIRIIHLMHDYRGARLNFIFEVDGTYLEPRIGEKDKCSELLWVNINRLPNNITKKVKRLINNIKNKKMYDYM